MRRRVRSDRCWRGKIRAGAERGEPGHDTRSLVPLTFVVLLHQVRFDVSVVRASHDHRARDDQGQSAGECKRRARPALPLLVCDEILAPDTRRTHVPAPGALGLSPGAGSIHDLLSRAPVPPHDPSTRASRVPGAPLADQPRPRISQHATGDPKSRTHLTVAAGKFWSTLRLPPHYPPRETPSKGARVEVRSIATLWARFPTGALSQPGAPASRAGGAASRTWRRRPIRCSREVLSPGLLRGPRSSHPRPL